MRKMSKARMEAELEKLRRQMKELRGELDTAKADAPTGQPRMKDLGQLLQEVIDGTRGDEGLSDTEALERAGKAPTPINLRAAQTHLDRMVRTGRAERLSSGRYRRPRRGAPTSVDTDRSARGSRSRRPA